ncbi:MAG: hypothetical protein CMM08_15145 [Rhodospirillaceae bacterium]|nr:hypothetical protein [Rhodospirillaceae bacterium]
MHLEVHALGDKDVVVETLREFDGFGVTLGFRAFANIFSLDEKSDLPEARCCDAVDLERVGILRNALDVIRLSSSSHM